MSSTAGVGERRRVPGASPVRPSRYTVWLAAAMAAWCVGFAVVNVWFELSGRFDDGPLAGYTRGLAVMGWLVVGLKLLGAGVAILTVTRRPARLSVNPRTLLVWGAFALLALYSLGSIAELGVFLWQAPDQITVRSVGYLAFFLAGALGYGALAWTYSRRVGRRGAYIAAGVVGAPVLLGLILLAAPAVLGAVGLLPSS